MTAIGDLRHLVTLQARAPGANALNEPNGDWQDVEAVWADVRHPRGLEIVRSEAQHPAMKASIRIRFREDVDTRMRVMHEGRIYDVQAVLPDKTGRRWLDLVCETGMNDG